MKKNIIIFFIFLLFGCSVSASDINNRISRAGDLLETGKPDSAAVLLYDLLDSIDSKEERVRALYYLAITMEQLGRLAEEINYLILAREAGPDVEFADKVRFAYAQILLDTGNLEGCIGIAREFKENYNSSPLMPDMLYIAGNALFSKGEYLRAFNSFNEIIKNYADTKAARESVMKEGVCLFHLELITGAIERLEQYMLDISVKENTDEALYYLGLSYELSLRPEDASEVFNRLVLEYPSYPAVMDVYFRLGRHYFNTNRFFESENAFENYIYNTVETEKNHDEALFYLERIKFRTGRYFSEAEIAENFIVKYPRSRRTPKLLFDLARYYKTKRKIEDAIEKYRILLNNPLYTAYADSAVILIADTYAAQGNRDKASVFLIQTAEESTEPERIQKIYLKLGTLNESWELYDKAIGWYDRSLTIDSSPDLSFKALWGIGRTFKTMNRWFEASKTLERILTEYPDYPDVIEIYLTLADIYLLQGRIKDSIDIAEKSIGFAGENRKNEILLFVAELYEEIDEDHALRLYSLIYNDTGNLPEHRIKALMQFGDLSIRSGDRRAALNAYAKILSEDADSISVLKAKRRITDINENKF